MPTIETGRGTRRARMTDWQLVVESRVRRVRAELNELPQDARREAQIAEAALAEVDQALRGANRWWHAVVGWWSGWYIERAWRALHEAEVWVTTAHSDLDGWLPGIRQRVADLLPESDTRRQALGAVQLQHPISAETRAVISDALWAAFDASDDAHAAARALRNKLIMAGVALIIVNTLVGVIGMVSPGFLPMCVRVPQIVDGVDKGSSLLCASGARLPSSGDVWLIQLLGAFGAIVSVIVFLVRRRPSLSPYILTGYQALIKVFLGAALAVLGVLGLSAGLVQGLTSVTSQAGLLLVAVLLGYAQQIGTRLVDNYADRVMDQVRPLPDQLPYRR